MKLEKFYKEVAPFYKLLFEKNIKDSEEFLKRAFIDFYINEATEDEIDELIMKTLEKEFYELDTTYKVNNYLIENDVTEDIEKLEQLLDLIGGIINE